MITKTTMSAQKFAVHILLAHKPQFGFVIRRGQYVEMMPPTSFSQAELEAMPTYRAPLSKYIYLYPCGHEFHTVEEIEQFINN
jgi:hypothetical protein